MAEKSTIPLPQLRLNSQPREEWLIFKQQYSDYRLICGIGAKPKNYQAAVFRSCLGKEEIKIYNSLVYAETEDKDDVELIISKLDAYIIGETNEIYERFKFNKREQKEDESVDTYVTALKELIRSCSYGDLSDSLLRDRIVIGISDNTVRKSLLQKRKLTLNDAVDMCKAAEAAKLQMSNMGVVAEENVHKIQSTREKSYKLAQNKDQDVTSEKPPSQPNRECRFCGQRHRFIKELCPAWGSKCPKCGKRNHFIAKCYSGSRYSSRPYKKKNVYRVNAQSEDEESDSDYERIMKVDESQAECPERFLSSGEQKSSIKARMLLIFSKETVTEITFQLDPGATINVIPKSVLPPNVQLDTYDNELKMWNNSTIHPLGKCELKLQNKKDGKKYKLTFVVVEEKLTPLIGKRASEQMGLIEVRYDRICTVTEDVIFKEFSDVFEGGIGTLPGKVHLTLDESVKPEAVTKCRVAINLKKKAKQKLDNMESMEVLAKVDEPTDWVSRMATGIKQNGDLRICLDPQILNKALKREYHPTLVLDDVLHELEGAVVLSKFDTDNGYWHCVLDESSSDLTTFLTPFGRYKYLRLPFGLCVSSEIFQKKLQAALDGLQGTLCIADDIVVYGVGKNNEEATRDHDKKLREFLIRCRDKGIRLNKKKTELRKSEINFLGYKITSEGLKADPNKIKAIVDMKAPRDVKEVQRFNGMVNYLARFLPHLSTTIEPLRRLTNKDVEWSWGSEQEAAFKKIKELVTSDQLLGYYSQEKPLYLQCDASQSGLGCALLQDGRPICYASKALTLTETKYAQIEKEMLAIVFGLRRFHTYTFGRHTTVLSDHKPLEIITKKSLESAPKRIQGMMLKTQMYDTEIRYQRGSEMFIADLLSRAHLNESKQEEFEYINMMKYLPIRKDRLLRIKEATSNDKAMKSLRDVIMSGWPEEKCLLPSEILVYFHFRDELTVQDGLIFRGDRVVIPASLRQEIKEAIHSSHVGIEGCLRRARECVYWPGMNADVKEFISSCEICASEGKSQAKETLMSHENSDRPWEKVGIDLFDLRNQTFLVTVDYFSNYWEVDRLEGTKTKDVVRKLKAHFSRYGVPSVVISDNGPQFSSEEFDEFSQKWEFEHRCSSPGHQQANGMAESAVKMAKKLIRKAIDSGRDPQLAILDYRNTPTQDFGSSPAQRMFGRRTRTLLPMCEKLLKPQSVDVEYNKKTKKLRNNRSSWYYNKKAKDLECLSEGDIVRMKPLVAGKDRWSKGIVKKRLDERSYEVATETGTFRRNRIHLKKVQELPGSLTNRSGISNPVSSTDNVVVESPRDETNENNGQPPSSNDQQERNQENTQRTSRINKGVKPAWLNEYVS